MDYFQFFTFFAQKCLIFRLFMKKWLDLQIKTSVRKMLTSSLHNVLYQTFRLKLKQKILAINCDLWIKASLKGTDESKNKAKLGLN